MSCCLEIHCIYGAYKPTIKLKQALEIITLVDYPLERLRFFKRTVLHIQLS